MALGTLTVRELLRRPPPEVHDGAVRQDPPPRGFTLVSRSVAERREPVRVMFREGAREPQDSGWRMYTGRESSVEAGAVDELVPVEIAELLETDPTVERVLNEDAPCAFEREREGQPFRRTALGFQEVPGGHGPDGTLADPRGSTGCCRPTKV